MIDEQPKPNGWAKPVIVGSALVLTLALFAAVIFPKARAAIATGIIVSPIPPIP